jgi:hypothetical protein
VLIPGSGLLPFARPRHSPGQSFIVAMVDRLVWATYPTCAVLVVLYGVGACLYMFIRQRRGAAKPSSEFFLTARHSVVIFFDEQFYQTAFRRQGDIHMPDDHLMSTTSSNRSIRSLIMFVSIEMQAMSVVSVEQSSVAYITFG